MVSNVVERSGRIAAKREPGWRPCPPGAPGEEGACFQLCLCLWCLLARGSHPPWVLLFSPVRGDIVLVSQGCWNKGPWTVWLKTAHVFSHGSGSRKSEMKVSSGPRSLGRSRGEAVLCLFHLLAAAGSPWLVSQPLQSLLSGHITASSCVRENFLCLPLVRTLSLNLGTTLRIQDRPLSKSLITYLGPQRVILTLVPYTGNIHSFWGLGHGWSFWGATFYPLPMDWWTLRPNNPLSPFRWWHLMNRQKTDNTGNSTII